MPLNGIDTVETIESSTGRPLEIGRGAQTPPVGSAFANTLHSAKSQRQDQVRSRIYPTVSYASRVSIFDDKRLTDRDFRGFFNLFWVGLGIFSVSTAARNFKETGKLFGGSLFELLSNDLIALAVSDFVMVATTLVNLPLHKAISNNYIIWNQGASMLQYSLECAWFAVAIYWPFHLNWSWTHQVFFCLHSIVLLMKTHSYGSYNGHLSEVRRELLSLSSHKRGREVNAKERPRQEHLAAELISPFGSVTYPNNITLSNYVDYLICPTLCYELEYPRTPCIRWGFLAEKIIATFGCIFLLYITSEHYMIPPLRDATVRLGMQPEWRLTLLVAAESVSMLLFPFMVAMLLVFAIIFDFVLNAFAEVSCFADRYFYDEWWNSTNWEEFSRLWNIPVYRFLLRHVYQPTRKRLRKPLALFVTFLISALVHELVMACITKKIRGYGLIAQMSQLPLTALSKMGPFKEMRTLGNCMFWISIIAGMAVINTVYCLL